MNHACSPNFPSRVRWLLQYVGRITDEQFREGLRASGASADEVECFTQSMRERINHVNYSI